MTNASIIERNLLSSNLGSYQGRRIFDSKGCVAQTLGWKDQPLTTPHLEDFWQNCVDEEEVIRKDHSRLTLQQINYLKLKFQLEGIDDDGSYIMKLGWKTNKIK